MPHVEVRKLIGENCITLEDGETVYRLIHPELVARHPIDVDFMGVEVYASPFLNAALGRLLEDLKPEVLNDLLKIHGMSGEGHALLVRVIENAKRYYSDPSVREAVNTAVTHLARDTENY